MTCSDGLGEDECGGVLRDVWMFLDDALDPERRAAVQRHLDDCSPCLEEAGLDSKLKQLLSRKCGGDQAPEYLRQRVFASLMQLRQTGTGGRVTTVTTTSVTATSVTVRWDGVAPVTPPEGDAQTGADGSTGGPGRR